jgi:nucleoside-diphosphate-sugar epimerase
MKKILITGLGGFTGQYIKSAFEKAGYKVVGLIKSEQERVTRNDLICDITKKETIKAAIEEIQFDGVIHLAALSFVGHPHPLDFYAVNVIGTQNLLEVLHETQRSLHKVILASSSNVYGNIDSKDAISEDVPFAPVSHYAISKTAMEFVARTYFDKLPIVITRPFNYTGPGQDERFLIPKIVSHYAKNLKSIELGNIDVARDFSDVRDVANAYFGLYESSLRSEVFNICSGKVYTIKEIMGIMNEVAGYEIEILVNKDLVRGNEIMVMRGDDSKLNSVISFSNNLTMRETLEKMYLDLKK